MITLEQAKKLTYRQEIYDKFYQNADGTPQRWRVNGQIKLWKTRPEHFKLPIKRGLWEYSYLTHDNAHEFALTEEEANIGIRTETF